MRKGRLLGGAGCIYHCMSRVVDRRRIFGVEEKRVFLGLVRKLEGFSGVQVLTYCLMGNHFHLLLRVPGEEALGVEGILGRIRGLYGRGREAEERQQVERLRRQGVSEEGVLEHLSSYRRRMGDLSVFMRELKQRFTQWYNRRTGRVGTLWEGRFKSVAVQDAREALLTVAHYIELNPVRAGLSEDPKDYVWCGYGAALGGDRRAREGIRAMYGALGMGEGRMDRLLGTYRMGLVSRGVERLDESGGVLRRGVDRETVRQTLAAGGALSRAALLRCRVRYFSDGVVVGSREFVEAFFHGRMDYFGGKRRTAGRRMRGGDWEGLHTARDYRKDGVG